MKSRTRPICSVAMLAMLAVLACAMAPALPADTPACPAGTGVLAEFRLFFGRSQGTVEVVTDEACRRSWPRRSRRAFPTV